MKEGSENAFAKYGSFTVSDASDKYRMNVGEFEALSTAGNSLSYHNSMRWTTYDQDNDSYSHNCAVLKNCPFWFKRC